jgi:PAS domain-containing protein
MGAYDSFKGVRVPVAPELLFHLLPGSPLTAARRPEDRVHGLILLPDGPAIVAASPITGTNGSDASVGTLVMVRPITDADAAALAERTSLPLNIERADRPLAADLAPLAQGVSSGLAEGPLGETLYCAMAVLPDLWGQPALRVELRLPRDIKQHGERALGLPTQISTAGALLCLALLLLLLQERLLRRVRHAESQLRRCLPADEVPAAEARRDPVESLERTVASVLHDLESLRGKLAACSANAEDNQMRLRSTINAIPTALILTDPESGRIREANLHAGQLTGYRPMELIGRPLPEVLRLPQSGRQTGDRIPAVLIGPEGQNLAVSASIGTIPWPKGDMLVHHLTKAQGNDNPDQAAAGHG